MFSVASRPRTLVVSIEPRAITACVAGPTGTPVTPRASAPAHATREETLRSLWTLAEALGDFDRITATCASSNTWTFEQLTEELTRQSLRPARVFGAPELVHRSVASGTGVELVITIGGAFGSALFVEGARVPGFDLGRHRLRRKKTYAQFVAGTAAERIGPKRWNTRLRTMIDEVEAVFAPRCLYLAGDRLELVQGDLPAGVEIVPGSRMLAAAVTLWT